MTGAAEVDALQAGQTRSGAVYLDNAATTRALPEVAAAVRRALEEDFGNPSSPHGLGVRAERLLRAAREEVAAALGVSPGEVVFTSGGTEANNLAVAGTARRLRGRGDHVVTTAVEHPSVLEACRSLEEEGFRVTVLPCDALGLVSPETLAQALEPGTVLVSTMHVNNEVGAVQPLAAFAEVLARHRRGAGGGGSGRGGGDRLPLWHVDAVQSFLHLPLEPRVLGVDLLSVSAHKVHGPKGAGALWVREGVELRPLIRGGGQEGGRRGGTENVPGIAGFAAAVAALRRLAEGQGGVAGLAARLAGLRDTLAGRIRELVPEAVVNGPAGARPADAAPHILSVAFPGLRGEVLVRALEEEGVVAATGAACSARRRKPSHVLAAMGLPPAVREGTLRFSLAVTGTAADVETAAAATGRAVARLRGFVRR